MTDRFLTASGLPRPGGAYSHLARAAGLVFTAGFGPHDAATGEVPEGVAAQTEATLANVANALSAVGLDLSHVVKTTVHLAELDRDFADFDAAYKRVMPSPYPVRTTVGSRLLGILVEIDVVAVTDEQ